MNKKKVILIIRDGRGYRKSCKKNAICQANTPNTDSIMEKYSNILLDASGEAVGLPDGYQGNSEVGHMTIGSGRIIFQSLIRINKSIIDNTFFQNTAFLGAISHCKMHNSTLHLMGLLQTQGVHAHIDHLLALLDLCKMHDWTNIKVHLFTDGRDAPVYESLKHIEILEDKFNQLGFGEIATVCGRYYAMDRDERWDRTKKAYDCIVKGAVGDTRVFTEIKKFVSTCHKKGETDEFIIPAKKEEYQGVQENDSMIFWNFRTDRTRQLTKAIVESVFDAWERYPLEIFYVGMTNYYEGMNGHIAFPDQPLSNLLGSVIADNNRTQLRISETEKYAHVTFFFNGQQEEPFNNEERILIPSPKVATYDLQPEMSVYTITEKLVEQMEKDFDLIVVNLVNGDMVGHTGIPEAIEKAVVAVDECVGILVTEGLKHGYTLLITADHGNAEDQTDEWRTSHTINPVPLILVSDTHIPFVVKHGGLQDIAPTILDFLEIKKPIEMTGISLINK